MSYHVWSVNGYGICTDRIRTDEDRLLKLIRMAPKFEEEYLKWIKDNGDDVSDLSIGGLTEWEDDYGCAGLAPIMSEVIFELENIRMTAVDDFNGVQYLVFEPAYPWSALTDEERGLTEKKLHDIIEKYVLVLADVPKEPEYQSVECGG